MAKNENKCWTRYRQIKVRAHVHDVVPLPSASKAMHHFRISFYGDFRSRGRRTICAANFFDGARSNRERMSRNDKQDDLLGTSKLPTRLKSAGNDLHRSIACEERVISRTCLSVLKKIWSSGRT